MDKEGNTLSAMKFVTLEAKDGRGKKNKRKTVNLLDTSRAILSADQIYLNNKELEFYGDEMSDAQKESIYTQIVFSISNGQLGGSKADVDKYIEVMEYLFAQVEQGNVWLQDSILKLTSEAIVKLLEGDEGQLIDESQLEKMAELAREVVVLYPEA